MMGEFEPQLTVVILALNEAERIGASVRSLAPLPSGTKLIVVDSYSVDSTIPAARDAWRSIGRSESDLWIGCESWPGFTEARNRSLNLVRTPWVFWLDADERLSPELARELSRLESFGPEIVMARVPRLNSFLGREIRHGGWYPDLKLRLGRAGKVRWRGGPRGADVHEDLVPLEGLAAPSSVARLGGHILHEPFRDEAEQRQTNERYSGLLAEGLAASWAESGRGPPPLLFVALRVTWKFFENYVWKAGFLDGLPGFKLALGSAWSLKERYRKARLLSLPRESGRARVGS